MVYKSRISAGNLCCTVSQERFLARKMRIRTMSIVPTLFLGVEYCATFQAALYIETHYSIAIVHDQKQSIRKR